jgi:putative ABC transport system substrate-binding protein
MYRRTFLSSTLAIACLPRNVAAEGATTKVAHIGWLTAQREAILTPFLAALRVAFADLGCNEGRNLAIEYRFGDDDMGRGPTLAAELVRLPVEIILVQGAAVPVVADLGLPVPVVYVFSGDPVSAGLADSLARPRKNMTGLTFMAAELNGKRLELLREIIRPAAWPQHRQFRDNDSRRA